MENKKQDLIFNIISFIIIIFLWVILSNIFDSPVIPKFYNILVGLKNAFFSEKFLINVLSTLKITFIGIFLGSIIGILIAIFCSEFNLIGKIVSPIINILRTIPAITLFPLILVIFGIGDISRIIIIFWTAMPPIMIYSYNGLKNIDKWVLKASSLDATKIKTLLVIKIPIASLDILNGIKIGIGTGFISVVTAEMLGATKGVGYMILWNTNSFKYELVYAYIIVVALLGIGFNLILNTIIKFVERRVKCKTN